MTAERFLVTGAAGCIGVWVLRNLVRERIPVSVLDLDIHCHRLPLVLTDEEIARIHFIQGDVSDYATVEHALKASGANRLIHLAALQLPFCKADPVAGARVNVVGTINLFEAAKHLGLKSLVYASSTAVYGLSEEYPEEPLAQDAPLKPRSHYGVYKQANEGSATVYFRDDGLSSIGLRPYVVYGAGRDQGMTSTPTQAILAAAAGKPYKISYGGRYCFQYADDTARAFIQAARMDFTGAQVFNIGGDSVSTKEVIAAIEQAEPSARGRITFEDVPLPFPPEVDNRALIDAIGPLAFTPLVDGVAETLSIFRRALAEGKIKVE
ncbi:MAG: NAD-dependent epimerase/dehydratase family protein [Anaerolineales bacterium]|jgi:nucleoside-diphosphate-sugar epimerase